MKVVYSLVIFFCILSTGHSALKKFDQYVVNRSLNYKAIAQDLIDNDLHFATIPIIKELMASGRADKEIEDFLESVMDEVGTHQFQLFDVEILERYKNSSTSYILAKKYFIAGKYDESLKHLNSVKSKNLEIFKHLLRGTIFSIRGNQKEAIEAFRDCLKSGVSYSDKEKQRQVSLARDACLAGTSRASFASKDYERANLSYLDIQKNSQIWPEILFDEAWNSFYMDDYNRSLGKLVTYKAPVFTHVFNPEIEILTALSYLFLCLYDDATREAEAFYTKYQRDSELLSRFIAKYKKDYKAFYLLAKSGLANSYPSNPLIKRVVKDINRDPSFIEMFKNFNKGKEEIQKIKEVSDPKLRKLVLATFKESLITQRDIIGAYVRKKMMAQEQKLIKSFEGMSYIKLEILSKQKSEIYSRGNQNQSRERGDFEYVKRNDKQYFWNFNGEFWADELGDYVFALKSECK